MYSIVISHLGCWGKVKLQIVFAVLSFIGPLKRSGWESGPWGGAPIICLLSNTCVHVKALYVLF